MKIATIIVRVLIGLVLLFASITYFFNIGPPQPAATDEFKVFSTGLVTSIYIYPMAKAIELLCGLSYVLGKYVSLANILILPITINILLINYFLTPAGLPMAIAIFIGNLFLIYRYWDNYKTVFTP
jgi:putative oxidoreductase